MSTRSSPPIFIKNNEPSTNGHRARLRDRFLINPESTPEYEVVELLLGYALPRKNTKPLAKTLLQTFGSIRGILDAKAEEIVQVEGVGPGIINFFLLLHEVFARYAEGPLRNRTLLCTPQTVAQMARNRLGRASIEEVWCAFVDSGNRLLTWEKLATGSINSSQIFPRDILATALSLKASGFILVHNHPGGSVTPSGADLSLTEQIRLASKTLGIRFIDHVIVTDSSCYSILADGLI